MSSFGPSVRQSRRAVIAGALGAAVASVAASLGRPGRSDATTGDAMFVGVSTMSASHETALTTTAGNGLRAETSDTTTGVAGLYGIASATDAGVYGVIGETPSDAGVGVAARSSATTGQTYGLAAGVHSDEGRAIQASAFSTTGANALAMYAENYSADGTVIWALAHGTAKARGILAQAGSADATAIVGYWGSGSVPSNNPKTAILGVADQDGAAIGTMGVSPWGKGVSGQSTDGTGVDGTSSTGHGVHGTSTSSFGVYGESAGASTPSVVGFSAAGGAGVVGHSAASGAVATAPAKVGVYGRSTIDSGAKGVYGYSTTGVGVYGSATTGKAIAASASGAAGIAVNATAADPTGYALKTSGRLSFAKVSGVASLAAGQTSVPVTPGTDITSSSFVLLTPRGDPGSRRLWYTVDAAANTLTIHASASAATSLAVAWLLVG